MAGDALLGREMGRYRIESIIGSGGFATVYRAIDLALERPIALKVVDPTAHRNPTIGRRFVLEGRAVASLDHPAIVPVYDAGESDGVLWMAMRLIPGGSLDDALVAGRRFTFEQVAAVVARIGDALDHAHGHGIVHRDVKPSNILLEQNDPARAWLADFGIAATTRTAGRYTTGALGTAAYMAPEQARPSSVGPPADLYSLGCVAYELLTRRRPFPGDDYVELLVAHATHPVPPTVWPRVDAFMQRALAKDPAARPASGKAFAEELRRTLIETERSARPAPPAGAAAPARRPPPPPNVAVPPNVAAGDADRAGAPDQPPQQAPVPADAAAAAGGGATAPPGRPPIPPPYRPGDPIGRPPQPDGSPRPTPGKGPDPAEPAPAQPATEAPPVAAPTPPQPPPAASRPDPAEPGTAQPVSDARPFAAPARPEPPSATNGPEHPEPATTRPVAEAPPVVAPAPPLRPPAASRPDPAEPGAAQPVAGVRPFAAPAPPQRPPAASGPDPTESAPAHPPDEAPPVVAPALPRPPAATGRTGSPESGAAEPVGAGRPTGDGNAAAAGSRRSAGGADPRPAPPRRDEPPTVVEHVERTLEHPHPHPHLRLPPPPSSPPGGVRPPPPVPRDPTAARNGRRGARRLLLTGGVLLAVGAVAGAVALFEQQRQQDDDRQVDDPAGISYDVPDGWELGDSQDPDVVFVDAGEQVATITHRPTDDRSASDQLDDTDPDVCDDQPVDGPDIAGAEQVAQCGNINTELPLLAIGAVAQDQFWVITVTQAATEADRDAFLRSIELGALDRNAP